MCLGIILPTIVVQEHQSLAIRKKQRLHIRRGPGLDLVGGHEVDEIELAVGIRRLGVVG